VGWSLGIWGNSSWTCERTHVCREIKTRLGETRRGETRRDETRRGVNKANMLSSIMEGIDCLPDTRKSFRGVGREKPCYIRFDEHGKPSIESIPLHYEGAQLI